MREDLEQLQRDLVKYLARARGEARLAELHEQGIDLDLNLDEVLDLGLAEGHQDELARRLPRPLLQGLAEVLDHPWARETRPGMPFIVASRGEAGWAMLAEVQADADRARSLLRTLARAWAFGIEDTQDRNAILQELAPSCAPTSAGYGSMPRT